MKLVSTFSERLKEILEIREIKPSKLAELVDINKSTISQYLNGEYEPKRNRIELFAKTLNVNEAWLIGYDVDMKRETQPKKQEKSNVSFIYDESDFMMIPLYSSISAGYGTDESEFIEMIAVPGLKPNGTTYFAVKVKGNSMEPKIPNGSTIIIKKDIAIENGEIGAFNLNDENLVKQKNLIKDKLILHSFNLAFDDKVVNEFDDFREYGKVVKVMVDL